MSISFNSGFMKVISRERLIALRNRVGILLILFRWEMFARLVEKECDEFYFPKLLLARNNQYHAEELLRVEQDKSAKLEAEIVRLKVVIAEALIVVGELK